MINFMLKLVEHEKSLGLNSHFWPLHHYILNISCSCEIDLFKILGLVWQDELTVSK